MRKQNGFTLLEVLVTLLIVSLGLLGIAGIIANSLKVNHGALVRSQASWLASDIIDRMRANRTAAEAVVSPYTLASCAAATASTTVAEIDLQEWCAAVVAALPSGSGTGSVAVEDAAGRTVTVVVQWNDQRAAGKSSTTTEKFTVETRL